MKNKSRQKKKKVWWLRLIHAVAFVFVLLLLCCVALLGFIQTEKGRNLLADILSEKLSGNGVYVNITGVKSGLPVLIGFDSLSVADKNGAWLRVDDVRLEWAWMEIFRKKVKVTLWKVDSIKMLRKPVMPSKKKEKSPNKSPSFAFLQGLGFELQYLSLNRVQLGSEQDNSNVTFSVKSDLAFQMLPKKMKLNLLVAGDVSGLIDVNAENKGFDGQIDMSIPNLGSIGGVFGVATGGKLECQTSFSNTAGRQSLQVKTSGNGFVDKIGSVSNLAVNIDMDDVYSISNGTAEISCDALSYKGLTVEESGLSMTSDDNVMALSGNIKGDWGVPFAISTTGSIALVESEINLNLKSESAAIAGLYIDTVSVDLRLPVVWLQKKNNNSENVYVKVAVKTDTKIDKLSHLPSFVNNIIKGDLKIDMSYEKQFSRVAVQGDCSLKNGYFENYTVGTIIDKLNITLVAKDKKISVVNGSAADRQSGKISLRGFWDLSSFKKRILDIELGLNKYLLLKRDDLKVTVSGGLQLKGTGGDIDFTGVINVDEGRLDLNDMAPALPPVLIDSANQVKEESSVENKSRKKKWDTAIALKTKGPFYIVGKGLNSVWASDLHFVNGLNGMVLKGEVESRSGSFLFLSREFVFDRGQISFDGRLPAVPVLNIVMIHERADIKARMIISGRADNPKISMDSIPAMPEDEVFAHILFGKNLSQISAFQAVQVATSMQGMRDGTNIDFMQNAKNSFGLDKVGFGTVDDGADSGTEKTTIAVGKYLTEGLYTEINTPIGVGSDARVTVEYEVRPNLTIETEAGVSMRPGMGVNWKMDY